MYVFICPTCVVQLQCMFYYNLVSEVVTKHRLQAQAERQLKDVCVCVWGCVLVSVCMCQDI